ncbi:hypothetical protein [Actinomyces sp. MRS3W]|uniref:hypothetical protein n=1 Tax=Actinomyces sp. MRS3W TaxID=2800796 RepID=UPI0028FD2EFC|nr:hypothetical protein [Actinomyces sp. MRS3W]MDU0349195.1 hypothetical protein [Actinomyces sp. MRS3W]
MSVVIACLCAYGTSVPARAETASDDDTTCQQTTATPLTRSGLEEAAGLATDLLAESGRSGEVMYTYGYTKAEADQVTNTVHLVINGEEALLTTVSAQADERPAAVSLTALPEPGASEGEDLLADSALPTMAEPAGYYSQTCSNYNMTCLKNLLKNGCSAGACAFAFFNSYVAGSCLAIYCFVGTQKCCTKWVQSWHEY